MRRILHIVDRVRNLRLVREISDDGLFDTAAGVAFWLILSLPAALLAGLSSVSLLGDDLTGELRRAVLEFVERVFTNDADTLTETVNELFDQRRTGVLSVSLAAAVFTVSRGFAGLIRALDTVYDVEESRNFAHTRLLAVGLALGTMVMVAATTALWAFGGELGLPSFVRVAAVLVMLVVWSATIFHIGPNIHTPWRYDLPGAFVAAAGWIVLSLGFGRYVRLVGTDGSNDVIGAAGALLLGLTFLWAVCVVLLVGGEINEIIAADAGVIDDNRTVLQRMRALQLRATSTGGAPSEAEDAVGADDSGGDEGGTDDAGVVRHGGRDDLGRDRDLR